MKTNVPRREFIARLGSGAAALGLGCPLRGEPASGPNPTLPLEEALRRARADNEFTSNWLTDLFDAIDAEVEAATRLRLLEACGRGCFRRHVFKQDIAAAGRGSVDQLVTAYRRNFGIERNGEVVDIFYGGGKCFCPAARNRASRANDLHCECTRATHQAIWESAMGRSYRIELVETVRRGGRRCHLRVFLS